MASLAEQWGTTDEMLRSVTGERSLIREAEDPRDQRDIDAQYGAALPPATRAPTVAESPAVDETSNAFMQWFNKDSTRTGLSGFFHSIGAISGGLAGIPLGGSDMSSMERAAVRAARAPGEARQRLQIRKFRKYVDEELAKNPSPQRRDMLSAAKMDPARAAQYLATESAESKRARAESLAKYRADLQLRNAKWKVGKGKSLTQVQKDDREAAAAWFRSQPVEIREGLKTNSGSAQASVFFDLAALKFMPLLYSPEGGPLYRGPDSFHIDPSKTVNVEDENGQETDISWVDVLEQKFDEKFGELSEDARLFWEMNIARSRHQQGVDDPERVDAVAGSIGME